MSLLAQQLDQALQSLEPGKARQLETLVREAIGKVKSDASVWPVGYFESTAGALQGEEFERADQGEFPMREPW